MQALFYESNADGILKDLNWSMMVISNYAKLWFGYRNNIYEIEQNKPVYLAAATLFLMYTQLAGSSPTCITVSCGGRAPEATISSTSALTSSFISFAKALQSITLADKHLKEDTKPRLLITGDSSIICYLFHLMSTNNTVLRFCWEIRKISVLFGWKKMNSYLELCQAAR